MECLTFLPSLDHLKHDLCGCTLQAALGGGECVCALLAHGAQALCRDVRGRTPLHLAASRGHRELLGLLLAAALHADPLDSLLDYSGYTPSHWAAYNGKHVHTRH